MLQIYNTLTKQKEEFKPLEEGKIGIYVCGMTVYDYCHMGHARMLVGFDMITRYLRYRGYRVTYVRNITDVDDKIIKRAAQEGAEFEEVVKRYIQAMDEDAQALKMIPPDLEPRATDHMADIIQLIQTLIDKGYAYVADNGDVYYEVSKFQNYGKLARKDLTKMRAGVRVEVITEKRDPLDFALWKTAKPGEPSWPSPWGRGRPGWHIECSAMSMKCLHNHFDIHGGGPDLVFPHHENEIAQSEAATGEKFVNTWMHVGSLLFRDEKMSKSLGNFCTIREALKDFSPEVLRYFLISSHYRSQINFSESAIHSAQQALARFYTSLRGLEQAIDDINMQDYEQRFQAAMDDDFNTPEALAVLFEMTHEINRLKEINLTQANQLGAGLKRLGGVLGLLQQDPETFLHGCANSAEIEKITQLVQKRVEARQNKDWQVADKIRDELTELGVEVEDSAEGTIWRRVR